jgi:hypothetical protein
MIDCNRVFQIGLAELIHQQRSKEIRNQSDLPAEILSRIVTGICQSPLVDESHKKRVNPDYHSGPTG